MRDCTLCPRKCHADRLNGSAGFCRQSANITAARAALHFWEEPCISGKTGSGAVFFSGCNLQCVFCQNHNIAIGQDGQVISLERLSEIFLELQDKGAANINLVTGSHFVPQICYALEHAKSRGLSIPIVYNSSGYDEISTLQMLDGLVDIYLPDLKYQSSALSQTYSHAADYFAKASAAIAEMFRQVGTPVFDDETGLMKKGVIVRHLLLPGQSGDSKRILRYLYNTYKNDIYVSIMNQYTPLPHVEKYPEINRKITLAEYEKIIRFAEQIGIENGFIQEGETASESFIPEFSGEGL
ncbi:MAG: radical SAM protein [Clostridia bacterium]|nr:radical SAM protein [Clostridia bacterium]